MMVVNEHRIDPDTHREKNPGSTGVARVWVQVTKKKPMGDPCHSLPPTRSRGTGSLRVDKVQPVPLPQHTLPETRTGFETPDNH